MTSIVSKYSLSVVISDSISWVFVSVFSILGMRTSLSCEYTVSLIKVERRKTQSKGLHYIHVPGLGSCQIHCNCN